MSPEQHPMHADRSDQQHRRAYRATDCHEIDRAHYGVESAETWLERQNEKKAGQQLDSGLGDTQLLQQARPVTVQPLGFRLVAVVVPTPFHLRMFAGHKALSHRIRPAAPD
jgi:hypothetical protein